MEPEEQLCRAEMEIKIHVRGVLHSLLNFLSTTQWFCNQEKGEGIFLQGNLFASFHPRHQRSRWCKEDKGSAMDCLLSYLSKVHFSRKYLSQEIHSVRWELVTWVLLKNATPWLCWRALGQSSVQMWVPNKWKWTLALHSMETDPYRVHKERRGLISVRCHICLSKVWIMLYLTSSQCNANVLVQRYCYYNH